MKRSPFKLVVNFSTFQIKEAQALVDHADQYGGNDLTFEQALKQVKENVEVIMVHVGNDGSTCCELTMWAGVAEVEECLTKTNPSQFRVKKKGRGYVVIYSTLSETDRFYFTEEYGRKIGVLV